VVEAWIAKRPNESPATQARRFTVIRQFCLFLGRRGYAPFIPRGYMLARRDKSYVPYIFSQSEIRKFFQAIDAVRSHPRSPRRGVIVPLVFRLLYGCGFRVREVLHLRVRDVDLHQMVITIREAKFLKDRLVPIAPSLASRLLVYASTCLDNSVPDAFFFPAPDGGIWSRASFYGLFRDTLQKCGIPHSGRGYGPRLHDLRHTFACHRLIRWLHDGVSVDLALPILSAYLGHESVYGTQRYLHLFPELYPDIAAKLGAYCGSVIPIEAEAER
jgi:integrase